MAYAVVIRKAGTAGGQRSHWIQDGRAWETGDTADRRADAQRVADAAPDGPWEVVEASKDQYWQAHDICWSEEITAAEAERTKFESDLSSGWAKFRDHLLLIGLTADQVRALRIKITGA